MEELDYQAVLRDFTYKPNFFITAHKREDRWWIRILMLVEDARDALRMWEPKPYADEDEYFFHDGFGRRLNMPVRHNKFIGYSPSRPLIEVVGNYTIPFGFGPDDDKEFISWLVYSIRTVENHEIDEWVRYKGELLSDPHKN